MPRDESALETAAFLLAVLREEVGAFPAFATPTHPIPAMMDTEARVRAIDAALAKGEADRSALGSDRDEIARLLRKARVMRARYLVRMVRRDEDVCAMLDRLDALVAAAPDVLRDVGMPAGVLDQAVLRCAA